MMFDPTETDRFRRSTEVVTRQAGIKLPYRKCCKCGRARSTEGGIQKRGTSRHNPGTFTCKECRN